MTVSIVADVSSTDLNKTSGKVLDKAVLGPVRISRRNQRFVVLREETLEDMLNAARTNRPQSLEDMLQGYDKDAARREAGSLLSAPPVGREVL